MKILKILFACLVDVFLVMNANAQQVQGFVHQSSVDYEWPTDQQVLEKLDQWQDLKFGVLFHWGLYSVPGIVESWSICSEDVDWISRQGGMEYDEYKKWYWGLKETFNPTRFDPGQWADVMEDAGMKYMIFTTKHHDGFCMFDSKYTDFSIAHGPFRNHPQKDVARYVFDAFRQKDFMIGCYFSKPDWHCEWFWNPAFATPNRRPNYKIDRHPDWWKNYRDFTYNQLEELMTTYGKFDILWLDGGWVTGEDIGLDKLLSKVRTSTQPGLISVDRTIRGKNENYQTPERSIPEIQLTHPWESCITLSNDWGWVPDAPYKSSTKVIGLLAEITAKGGCLLLGVGPTPQGTIEEAVRERLHRVGEWLRVNGKAIYHTRITPVYQDGNTWFTADKDGKTLYAIYALPDGENLPETIEWTGNVPVGRMKMLKGNRTVKYTCQNNRVKVFLPRGLENEPIALQFTVREPELLYKQASAPLENRVSDLIGRMTVEEKIGQLCCPLGWEMYTKTGDAVVVSDLYKERMKTMPVGSFWAVLRADPWTRKTLETGLNPELSAKALNALQKYAVEETRLGIPLLFAEECPHGHMAIGTTVFPTSLLQASTWNPALIYKMGEAIALEARLQGAHIGYGPVLDIAREPRWSRMEETFGEDPVLTTRLGVAFMKGMQGETQNDGKHLYSTLKHFAAYGIPEAGHNGARANIGMRQLFSDYLPPFKKAVEEGAATIMTAYNSIDGIPCTSNSYLLTDVLRHRWGFEGFVYSDLAAIEGIAGAKVAKDRKDAAVLALKAGVDMDLGGNAYGKNLRQALEEKAITTEDLDKAVARVLRLKFRMGLFENPYVSPQQAKQSVRSQEHKELAYEVAREGIVLLKNDGVLPLKKNIRSIAVIGPNADMMYNQLGDYTAPQERKEIVTVLDGIRKAVSPSTKVTYVKGCAIRNITASDIPAAVEVARQAEVVVLVLGGSSARDFKTQYIETGAATVSNENDRILSDMDCGEGFDRSSLRLLGDQEKLLEAVAATGKPLVVVYIQGRPLNMNSASEKAQALLTAWYPGEQGGRAIADILFGDYNPAGRLPVSVPRSEGQLPLYYAQGTLRAYVEEAGTPLYAFGYGLSYTDFEYSQLELQKGNGKDCIQIVSCTVTNTGDRDGEEVVQLYISDKVASVSQAPILLKAFERIALKKGESKKVTFKLGEEELSLYNIELKQVVEPGDFKVMIGAASNDIRLEGEFTL